MSKIIIEISQTWCCDHMDAFSAILALWEWKLWGTCSNWTMHSTAGTWEVIPNMLIAWTHWGRVTYIRVGKLTIIVSDNGLSPGRRQAIIWINVGILLIWPLGTNFSEILIGIQTFSFKKMYLKTPSAKWRPFCLGLNVLISQHRRSIHEWSMHTSSVIDEHIMDKWNLDHLYTCIISCICAAKREPTIPHYWSFVKESTGDVW